MIKRHYFFTGYCNTSSEILRVHGHLAIKSWLPKPKDAYDEAIRLSKEYFETNHNIISPKFHLKSLYRL